jgi:predicted RNase H-like nuclease (RuvC/YqgF family)
MEPSNSKIFDKKMMQTVSAFCESQEIKDVDNFMYLCFKQGFDIRKYGLLGKTLNEGEKDLKTGGIEEKRVEIEVIREIRVEVPVEVIKEVEKVVTKIEYISDKTGENELLLKIQQLENEMSKKNEDLDELRRKFSIKEEELNQLRQEFSTKDTENESFFQNEMSKKDLELDELRQKLDDPVTNNNINMLQNTLQKLRGELSEKNQKIKELEQINKGLSDNQQTSGAYLLRGSNLNRRV